MSQITEINKQILTAIDKDDEFYEALWGKEEFIPESVIANINDFNCGACANALEYVSQFIDELIEQDINVLDTPWIDIIVYFFTGFKRKTGEDNEALITRMQSLLIRECDWRSDRWGTPWDVLNVLCYYLDRSFLFYVPNKVHTNLIENGGFENPIDTEWTVTGGDRSTGDSFSGSYKLDFSTITSASQTVAVTAGTYILHSFIKPVSTPSGETSLIQVDIQRDSDSLYWNVSTLEWEASNPNNTFTGEEDAYQLMEYFIIADDSYNITIDFIQIEDVYLDRVELGIKEYPYWEIIYTDTGIASEFASLWDESETDYTYSSFLDQDFLLGSATTVFTDTFYQNIIDILRSAGVKADFTREVRL